MDRGSNACTECGFTTSDLQRFTHHVMEHEQRSSSSVGSKSNNSSNASGSSRRETGEEVDIEMMRDDEHCSPVIFTPTSSPTNASVGHTGNFPSESNEHGEDEDNQEEENNSVIDSGKSSAAEAASTITSTDGKHEQCPSQSPIGEIQSTERKEKIDLVFASPITEHQQQLAPGSESTIPSPRKSPNPTTIAATSQRVAKHSQQQPQHPLPTNIISPSQGSPVQLFFDHAHTVENNGIMDSVITSAAVQNGRTGSNAAVNQLTQQVGTVGAIAAQQHQQQLLLTASERMQVLANFSRLFNAATVASMSSMAADDGLLGMEQKQQLLNPSQHQQMLAQWPGVLGNDGDANDREIVGPKGDGEKLFKGVRRRATIGEETYPLPTNQTQNGSKKMALGKMRSDVAASMVSPSQKVMAEGEVSANETTVSRPRGGGSTKSGGPKTVHTCPICNFTTCMSQHMKSHLEAHERHQGAMYQCDICSMQFSQKANMHRHRMRHSGVKPYRCRYCAKQFFRKDQMQEHSMTHIKTGDDFDCPVAECNRQFGQHAALRAHLNDEHEISSLRQAHCKRCTLSFSNSRRLLLHYQTKHDDATGEQPMAVGGGNLQRLPLISPSAHLPVASGGGGAPLQEARPLPESFPMPLSTVLKLLPGTVKLDAPGLQLGLGNTSEGGEKNRKRQRGGGEDHLTSPSSSKRRHHNRQCKMGRSDSPTTTTIATRKERVAAVASHDNEGNLPTLPLSGGGGNGAYDVESLLMVNNDNDEDDDDEDGLDSATDRLKREKLELRLEEDELHEGVGGGQQAAIAEPLMLPRAPKSPLISHSLLFNPSSNAYYPMATAAHPIHDILMRLTAAAAVSASSSSSTPASSTTSKSYRRASGHPLFNDNNYNENEAVQQKLQHLIPHHSTSLLQPHPHMQLWTNEANSATTSTMQSSTHTHYPISATNAASITHNVRAGGNANSDDVDASEHGHESSSRGEELLLDGGNLLGELHHSLPPSQPHSTHSSTHSPSTNSASSSTSSASISFTRIAVGGGANETGDHLTACYNEHHSDHTQKQQSKSQVSNAKSRQTHQPLEQCCVHCGLFFTDPTLHLLHKGLHSSESQPFRCNLCGVHCSDKYTFTAHVISSDHREERGGGSG